VATVLPVTEYASGRSGVTARPAAEACPGLDAPGKPHPVQPLHEPQAQIELAGLNRAARIVDEPGLRTVGHSERQLLHPRAPHEWIERIVHRHPFCLASVALSRFNGRDTVHISRTYAVQGVQQALAHQKVINELTTFLAADEAHALECPQAPG
jgi:hypothetical protein